MKRIEGTRVWECVPPEPMRYGLMRGYQRQVLWTDGAGPSTARTGLAAVEGVP